MKALAGDNEYKPDNHQSARIAAEGLAEDDSYKLSSQTRKSLHAVVGESVDPSQCSRILAELVFRILETETTQACGDAKALEKRLLATKSEADRAKEAAKACRVEEKMGFEAGTAISAPALITAVVVGQILAKDPASDADEKSLARAIRYICDGSPSR